MKDIIDEVKEDLHNEAFSNIVKKYGRHVVFFIVMAISVTSVFMYIKHRNYEQQERLSKIFLPFYKNPQKEIPAELKDADKNIYSDLAYLESANMLKNKKNYKAALEKLYVLVKTTKYIEIKNLAKIHAAFIVLDNKMIDESKKILKNHEIANSKEPFSEVFNWSLAQLHIMNNDIESAKNILKSLDASSNIDKTMNGVLKNSIIMR